MPLIVILRDDDIEIAAGAAKKNGVAGPWAGGVVAGGAGIGDSGCDVLNLLAAEEAAFAGVRIQAGDSNARVR